MSDLLHRLNPFRPASPAKPPPHSQLRTSSPIRKRTKSPHHLTLYLERDRPDSAAGHLPSRASSSLESPLPDVPYGRYLLDTQRSMDLDRPVFTPVPSSPSHSPYPHTDPPPTTTPGRRARTPSILRTLAHHPSLSALKGKQKREKKREVEEREERLSGSVDDEVPERDEEERKGWMGTWGSAKKKRARKGSLKLAKSMPSVRTSDESDGELLPPRLTISKLTSRLSIKYGRPRTRSSGNVRQAHVERDRLLQSPNAGHRDLLGGVRDTRLAHSHRP